MSDQPVGYEVSMRPFPGPGSRIQISTNRVLEPHWSRDGQELFYRGGDRMMSVSLSVGSAIDVRVPEALFEGRFEYAT